jgi:Ca2+-binding RTX toxin-like protein
VQGTSASQDLVDVLQRSDVLEGVGGQDRFLFISPGKNAAGLTVTSRGGVVEKDIIWDFNPVAGAEHDTVVISKALAGTSQFSTLYRNIKDVDGDAVLRFADGSTLTFEGVKKADLSYDDFVVV